MNLKSTNLAFLAASLASGAHAQIVNIDVSAFTGINGGAAYGSSPTFNLGPFSSLQIHNSNVKSGVDGDNNLVLGINSLTLASPRNFAFAEMIDGSVLWGSEDDNTLFKRNSSVAPDWLTGSYMGFRAHNGSGSYYYGWLEMTWDSANNQFEILSGAYESTLNQGIQAGATRGGTTGGGGAVPEPGEWAAMGVLAAGLTGLVLRKRRKA
jgi:hypothetical protein